MTMRPCCLTCVYWDDHGDEEDAKPRTGDCRRYPPQRNGVEDDDDVPMHRLWSQPVTGEHWWCGEHRQFSPEALAFIEQSRKKEPPT